MNLLEKLIKGHRENAVIGWTLTAVVAFGAFESFLTNDFLWGAFAVFIVAVISMPAVWARNWLAMVPWPLLLVTALAVILRATGYHLELAGYVAIATVALVIVLELDGFTPVELSRRFAIIFAVLTTMALQGLWAIPQFYSDRWLGTEFLRTQVELQWDFVLVTAVGVVFGLLFGWYFERVPHVDSVDREPTE